MNYIICCQNMMDILPVYHILFRLHLKSLNWWGSYACDSMLGKHRCRSAKTLNRRGLSMKPRPLIKMLMVFLHVAAERDQKDFHCLKILLLPHCSSLTASHSSILTGNFGASQRRRGCDRRWRICVCPGEERLREGWSLDPWSHKGTPWSR